MSYQNSKNLGERRFEPKRPYEFALTLQAWGQMLAACEATKDINVRWKRDHAVIFLGGALGLRVGECCILERKHFRDLSEHDRCSLPTLKQSERISFVCKNPECIGRKCKVRSDKAGQQHPCPRCGKLSYVAHPKWKPHVGILEKDVNIIESATSNYILNYIDVHMRPDQRWLFEGRSQGKHIASGSANRIFNSYLLAAGLNPKISYHSLRHLRGVRLWSTLNDLKAVQHGLRHKSMSASQIYADLDEDKRQAYKKQLDDGALDPLKPKRRAQ